MQESWRDTSTSWKVKRRRGWIEALMILGWPQCVERVGDRWIGSYWFRSYMMSQNMWSYRVSQDHSARHVDEAEGLVETAYGSKNSVDDRMQEWEWDEECLSFKSPPALRFPLQLVLGSKSFWEEDGQLRFFDVIGFGLRRWEPEELWRLGGRIMDTRELIFDSLINTVERRNEDAIIFGHVRNWLCT